MVGAGLAAKKIFLACFEILPGSPWGRSTARRNLQIKIQMLNNWFMAVTDLALSLIS